MAWRFKASKYKNAAPVVPKPENYVRDICVGSYQTYGNNICASAKFMAFNWDHTGSSLAVLPIDDSGRKSKLMPLLHAHSDTVTDLEFSPFHDGLLATGSQDCLVKIWSIPADGLQESLSNPECTFSHKQRRVETVGFHPTADCLLHSTSFTTLTLWDLLSEQEIFSNSDHSDVIQSVCWKRDGTFLATSCKDKQVRILDPRVEDCIIKTANSHQSIKDSRVVWLGDHNKILTTGFDSQRLRQIIIRDLRNFGEAEKSLELDCSTGILIPLYDPDTGMLFLAGKGDTTIGYMEVIDKEPYLIEGIRHSGEQTKGACLVPKRALNVMQGEVNRILQLTSSSVIPITYQVPRKTYRDFHADLYPDTPGYKTDLTAAQWIQGKNIPLNKISLDPMKRENGEEPIVVIRGSLLKLRDEYKEEILIEKSTANKIKFQPKITAALPKTDYSLKEKNDIKEMKEIDNEEIKENSPIDTNKSVNENNKINMEEVPPKPLPRTCRTGSVCELFEDGNVSKPMPRPRTNSITPVVTSVNPNVPIAGGYKPRLGPKPFTPPKLNDSESFDKVFSVPSAPQNLPPQNGIHQDNKIEDKPKIIEEKPKIIEEKPKILEEKPGVLDEKPRVLEEKPRVLEEKPRILEEKLKTIAEKPKIEKPLIIIDKTPEKENEIPIIEDGDDYKPRTPSTAERRKVFETRSNSKDDDENLDAVDFDRQSLQRSSIAERRKMYENRSQSMQETGNIEKPGGSPILLRRKDSFKNRKNEEIKEEKKAQLKEPKKVESAPTPKRTSTVFGRVSKFRHLKGTPAHKSFHIENIRNISRQISGECDGFHANPERVAVPLSGPGGKIAIFELKKTGRLPDGVIPALVNGSNVMDFQWDPFNYERLTVACDDGIIKLWQVPENGLVEPTNEPDKEFNAHNDKIYFIKFHPTAQDVLASGSYDMTIKIWDLSTLEQKIVLNGHSDQIFSFAWSPNGTLCATVSKDSKIRVYKPRTSDMPIREGKGPVGSRGARVVWALDGNFLVVTGFDKVSERQILVFKSNDLNNSLNTIGLDVSPAILIPFYDEDSSTLFLTGKGDSTIYTFEITEEAPYICALSHHRCNNLHQGLSFLPKNVCDVSNVEFAKALRLTNNTIEPLSFTVPRIKTDLFQDDLFPPTKLTWKPVLTSTEWFIGKDKTPARVNLKPEGMDNLSESQERTINKSASTPFIGGGGGVGAPQPFNRLGGWQIDYEKNKAKQEEIQKSMSSKMEINLKLEQDDMEGVDEKEWDE